MVLVAAEQTPVGAAVAGEVMNSWPAQARRIETEDPAATRARRRRAGVHALLRSCRRSVGEAIRRPVRCHVARATGRQSASATIVSRSRWKRSESPAWACTPPSNDPRGTVAPRTRAAPSAARAGPKDADDGSCPVFSEDREAARSHSAVAATTIPITAGHSSEPRCRTSCTDGRDECACSPVRWWKSPSHHVPAYASTVAVRSRRPRAPRRRESAAAVPWYLMCPHPHVQGHPGTANPHRRHPLAPQGSRTDLGQNWGPARPTHGALT